MKIGISRHFRIPHQPYKWMGPAGFKEWIYWYDEKAPVPVRQQSDVTDNWDICFSSDILRAKITAKALYKKDVIINPDLKEIPFAVFPLPLPLPVWLWKVMSRVGWWMGSKSQPETRPQSLKRVKNVLQVIIEENTGKNILIITHGFFMQYLQKELINSGFAGSLPLHPDGGIVYTFEKIK